jgi:hypothetical protein
LGLGVKLWSSPVHALPLFTCAPLRAARVNACDVFASALFLRPLVLVSLIAYMPPVNARHIIININPTTSLPHILQVLIFSQMVKMIDFIDEFCEFRKYPCERLDGRIAGNERQKSIDRCVHLYLWVRCTLCVPNLLESTQFVTSWPGFVHYCCNLLRGGDCAALSDILLQMRYCSSCLLSCHLPLRAEHVTGSTRTRTALCSCSPPGPEGWAST